MRSCYPILAWLYRPNICSIAQCNICVKFSAVQWSPVNRWVGAWVFYWVLGTEFHRNSWNKPENQPIDALGEGDIGDVGYLRDLGDLGDLGDLEDLDLGDLGDLADLGERADQVDQGDQGSIGDLVDLVDLVDEYSYPFKGPLQLPI